MGGNFMKYKFLLTLLLVLIASSFAFAQTQAKPGKTDIFEATTLAGNYARVLYEKGLIQCSKTAPVKCNGQCCKSNEVCQEANLGKSYAFVCATTKICKSNCGNRICDVEPICNGSTCTCAETPDNCKQDCTKPAPK